MSGTTRRDVSTAQLMKTHGYSARTDYHKDKQDAQAVRELAREILRLTRSTLLIHMRFLESALVCFVPGDETVTPEMATDGKFLYYNSIHICRLFKTSPQLVCRDWGLTALGTCIALLVLWAHRSNIKRLLNGTESKFHFHVNGPKTGEDA